MASANAQNRVVGEESPLLTPRPSTEPPHQNQNQGTRTTRHLHHHQQGPDDTSQDGDVDGVMAWTLRRAFQAVPTPLRALPLPALQLIGLLIFVNAVVWAACGVVLHFHPLLISSAVLAYTLGLRHALDADHISATDLVTRRLIASGQRPVAVGTFFSLGHSTVVVVTCVVVAATTGALRNRFGDFAKVGNIVGTSVSAAFLLLLCVGNSWVLWRLVGRLRAELRRQDAVGHGDDGEDAPRDIVDVLHDREDRETTDGDGQRLRGDDATVSHVPLEGAGFLAVVFRRLFRVVDRPWKMFPLGLVFGLGFDTSSEIALLGLASIHSAEGTSLWLILVFPVLFTAGMCMLDTTDGALMMALYTSKAFSRDVVAILYYSAVLTGITIFVSAFIGLIQVLSLVQNAAEPEGPFWDAVDAVRENFDVIGGCICGVFLLVGVGSVFVYLPWRRRMEARARARAGIGDRGVVQGGETDREQLAAAGST